MTDTDILLSWKTPSQLNHAPAIAYKVQMGYIGEFALLCTFYVNFLKSIWDFPHIFLTGQIDEEQFAFFIEN